LEGSDKRYFFAAAFKGKHIDRNGDEEVKKVEKMH
jgi:hypothetical protein